MIRKKHVKYGLLFFALSTVTLLTGVQLASAFIPPIDIPVFVFPPFLGVVTPVAVETIDTTPAFTFSSSEAGTISYMGDCTSPTTSAVSGNNAISFSALPIGLHNNCKLKVNGSSTGLDSAWLDVPAFTVKDLILIPLAPIDFPPFLSIITPVPTTTFDAKPEFVFSSTKAGTIMYIGDCSSTTTAATAGNNTVQFNALSVGSHSNCRLTVTSSTGMVSSALIVPTFEVQTPPVLPPAVAICAGFSDVTTSDSECDAVVYVKSIGAMTGNPDGTFAPNDLLQRDQISKIALESFGKFSKTADYCGGVNPFSDVTEASWAYQYVCRAKGLGVVTGYLSGADAGKFKPARTVNRSEFLAIVLRNLSETMPTGSSYNDVDASSWYAGYAKFSKNNNLFSGSNLSPTSFTSRKEVAEVLFKLHNLGKI